MYTNEIASLELKNKIIILLFTQMVKKTFPFVMESFWNLQSAHCLPKFHVLKMGQKN